ncbi:Ionotropic glutamate receptor [Pusillimonas sp. T7-7]|uniref:transporter substrate-binding domain-containing protein n=1 Tax=Pusillimonas sp. (strain T7-7) TaxID=1007105 RepID=UPI000208551E|nr:transporter substrate-binding domain-containing protein [Pusillimonas sp. T7-7]AEC19109.1 Ionotropic glutamate receptor [Pusillimonas sp. T7-7]
MPALNTIIRRRIRYGTLCFAKARTFLGCFVLAFLTIYPVSTFAQAQSLVVGVLASPPFVIENNGKFTGLAIDLWEELASENEWQSGYRKYETFRELLDATESGHVDLAMTNITITQQRALKVDFTQPWFDGGMRLMVSTEQGTGFRGVLKGLAQAGFITAYAWIALVIVLTTALLTLFDRRFDTSFPARWRDGVAESFYTVMSVVTSGRPPSRKNLFGWIGRIWQALWLVCGIAVLAFVTSSVTSVMTTLSLSNQISSVNDLDGRPVGVLIGTVEEDYAHEQGLSVRSYSGLANATAALLDGEVTAIIADAPVLEYYAHTNPDVPVSVVGRLFERDKYGFALPRHSPLTRDVTLAVLGAVDAGRIEELEARYFGVTE